MFQNSIKKFFNMKSKYIKPKELENKLEVFFKKNKHIKYYYYLENNIPDKLYFDYNELFSLLDYILETITKNSKISDIFIKISSKDFISNNLLIKIDIEYISDIKILPLEINSLKYPNFDISYNSGDFRGIFSISFKCGFFKEKKFYYEEKEIVNPILISNNKFINKLFINIFEELKCEYCIFENYEDYEYYDRLGNEYIFILEDLALPAINDKTKDNFMILSEKNTKNINLKNIAKKLCISIKRIQIKEKDMNLKYHKAYFKNINTSISHIDELYSMKDIAELKKTIHKLKGGALTIKEKSLAGLLYNIEEKLNNEIDIYQDIFELKKEILKIKNELNL